MTSIEHNQARVEPVQQWAGRHLTILTKLNGQPVSEVDFTDDRLAICYRPTDGCEPDLNLAVASGFEVTRPRTAIVEGQEITWQERLLVVCSYSYMKSELAGLRRRLEKAEAAMMALTPSRQRGKKQIQTEGELLTAIEKIEKKCRVTGFFHCDYQAEIEERAVNPDFPAASCPNLMSCLTE